MSPPSVAGRQKKIKKESVSVVLKRDHGLRASPSTVQRYLHKHLRIEPKISERNKKAHLEKQRRILASSRRLKNKEQIEKLMQFIDAKLNQKIDLNVYKLELIKCELCSWGLTYLSNVNFVAIATILGRKKGKIEPIILFIALSKLR